MNPHPRHVHARQLSALAAAVAMILGLAAPAPARASTTFTVTANNDVADLAGCDATHCSLREAIMAANADTAHDTIGFSAGVGTIVTSGLPPVTSPVTIDGTTHSSHADVPVIEIVTSGLRGLELRGAGSVVRGLAVRRAATGGASAALVLAAGGMTVADNHLNLNAAGTTASTFNIALDVSAGGHRIEGNVITGGYGIFVRGGSSATGGNAIVDNLIGTDVTGTIALSNPNGAPGIDLGPDGGGNLIHGNVISSHNSGLKIAGSSNNTVTGNYIGTDVTGTVDLGNKAGGLSVGDTQWGATTYVASNNRIGGTTAEDRNVISGNGAPGYVGTGLTVGGRDNVVVGNFIGTDVSGHQPLPNARGVQVQQGTGNVIGGSDAGEANVISGNHENGLQLSFEAGGTAVQGNLIGVAADGTTPLGNGASGVSVSGLTDGAGVTIGGSQPGQGNVIAHNGATYNSSGVFVDHTSRRAAILGNSIHSNARIGIDLIHPNPDDAVNATGWGPTQNDLDDTDSGGNDLQNFPVLGDVTTDGTSTTAVDWSLDSTANTEFRVEFFANDACDDSSHGEGARFLGAVAATTTAAGTVASSSVLDTVVTADEVVTAIATGPGGTSEFSACGSVVPPDVPSWTVNTTDDTADTAGCTTHHCSLREAILRANTNSDTNTILFDIDGEGPHTISLAASLPVVSWPVVIDGSSQPGHAGAPLVHVTRPAGTSYRHLYLNHSSTTSSGGSVVKGLAFIGFISQDGLYVAGPDTVIGAPGAGNVFLDNRVGLRIASTATGSVVQSNWFGTDATDVTGRGNTLQGLSVDAEATLVGGTDPSERNIISGNRYGIRVGNGSGARVIGNYIGTDSTGTDALPNTDAGILTQQGAKDTIIGETAPGAGNVISGNNGHGVLLSTAPVGSRHLVQGNLIGVAADGTALGNGRTGLRVLAGGSVIGGDEPGEGNVVAHNGTDGVNVPGSVAGISILGNSIDANGELGIDLGLAITASNDGDGVTANDTGDGDTGPNDLQNFPMLGAATTAQVAGQLDSLPGDYTIELFASAECDPSRHGEGARFLTRDTLTVPSGSTPSPASFALPVAGVAGGEFVTATATGPDGSTSEFSACVEVVQANGAPEAGDDEYTVAQGGTLDVTVPGVLDNDTDPDGDALAARFVAGPTNGTLTLQADGSFTYVPSSGFSGSDSFTYRASDGVDVSATATVTITVLGNPPQGPDRRPRGEPIVARDGSHTSGYNTHPSISEEGRYVAFLAEDSDTNHHVVRVDRETGQTLYLTPASRDLDPGPPSISHDGTRVAFGDEELGVILAHVDATGGVQRQTLAAQHLVDDSVHLSGDGRFVLFLAKGASGSRTVHRWSVGGTVEEGPTADWGLSVSDDGAQVAFERDGSVWVHDFPAGATKRVGREGAGSDPAIAGNGTRVAFHTTDSLDPRDDDGDWDVYVHDLVTGQMALASLQQDGSVWPGDSSTSSEAMSSGGDLVFGANSSSSFANLLIRDADGSAPVLVNVDEGGARVPVTGGLGTFAMAGGGRFVAFEQLDARAIWVVDLDTPASTPLPSTLVSINNSGDPLDEYNYGAGISGTGRYAVFESEAANLDSGPSDPTYLVRHDREEEKSLRITNPAMFAGLYTSHPRIFGPSISGDGTVIAFVAIDAGSSSVHVVEVDPFGGLHHTVLASDVPWARDARVSHDGRFVIYRSSGTIYRVATDGSSDPEAVGSGSHASISRDGALIAFESDLGSVDVVDVDAGTRRTVVPEAPIPPAPSFSANGAHVLYHTDDGAYVVDITSTSPTPELVSLRPDGTPVPRVGRNNHISNAISAEGTRVLYEGRGTYGGDLGLFVHDRADGSTVQVNFDESGSVIDYWGGASLSSDGSSVVFYDNDDLRVWVVDVGDPEVPSDTVPPTVTGIQIATDGTGATVHATGSDGLAGSGVAMLEYRLEGTSQWHPMVPSDGAYGGFIESATVALMGLVAGDHRVHVRATDTAGNISSVNFYTDFTIAVGTVSSTALAPGGTLSTGDDATASAPVQASVTTPTGGGPLSIATVPSAGSLGSGYALLGHRVTIHAPPASADDPLVLTFVLDSSVLGSMLVADVQVFRNGSNVADCAPGAAGADPDPCVAERTDVGGDARIVVRTSQASDWDFGVSPRTVVGGIRGLLAASSSKEAGKALKHVDKALDDAKAWSDGGTLDPRHGKKVFGGLRKAAHELDKSDANAATEAAEQLRALARTLAEGALSEAPTGHKETAKAHKEFDRGEAQDDPDKAIEHYRKAWERAMKAAG